MSSLEAAFLKARRVGHSPSIYARGRYWRVHLDVAGNTWKNVRDFRGAANFIEKKLAEELKKGRS